MKVLTGVLRRRNEVVGALLVAAVLFAIATAIEPAFASATNLRSLSNQASFIGLAALGQTLVILTGGVDLSIPWVMSSSALLLAVLTGQNDAALWWTVPVTLAYGASIGLINGIGVSVFGLSPIIMTLAMNTVLSGTSSIISSSLNASLPHSITDLGSRHFGPVTIDVAIWIVAGVVVTVVLAATAYGRRVYAVGSNARVARFSGVNVIAVRILVYVISGISAAAAGIMVGGYGGQAFGSLGDPYLFASVAAVAIGGASIYGGSGSYVGTVAGALVLVCLTALLPILNLSPATLSIAYGLVILITVWLARLRSDERERIVG